LFGSAHVLWEFWEIPGKLSCHPAVDSPSHRWPGVRRHRYKSELYWHASAVRSVLCCAL